jgi:hypothetical protein
MNLHEDIQRIKEVMGVLSEQDTDQQYDFYKTTYNPEDKTIVGAYMITGEDENTIQIMNVKETPKEGRIYMDNAQVYLISYQKVDLPKSQVEILDKVDGMDGFNFIKIPYWLFKKLDDKLVTNRIKGKKRLDVSNLQLRNNDFLRKLNDPDLERYLMVSNPDKGTMDNLNYAAKKYKPTE